MSFSDLHFPTSKLALTHFVSYVSIVSAIFATLLLTTNTLNASAANPVACTAGGTTNLDNSGNPACAGKVQYRLKYSSINCTANTFDFEVQVKSDPLYPQPIMGDYNIRFDYDTTVMKRIGTPASQGSLIQRNRYASGAPASNTDYGAQTLTGSQELATPAPGAGIISLNGFFSSQPGDLIPTTFATISTMRMNIINPAAPLNINLHNATLDFPITGNNIVLDDGIGGFDYINPAYETANIDLVGFTQNQLCAPVTALDDGYFTAGVTPVVLTPLTNDSVATTIQSINSTSLTGAAQTIVVAGKGALSVTASEEISFIANPGYTGLVQFPYVIKDSTSLATTATANISVVVGAPVGEVCTNNITNGGYTGNITGWTAAPEWVYNNSTAAFTADNATNKIISQSISSYTTNGGQLLFKIELQPAEANNLTTFGATLDISFGGVKYLSIINPIGTGNIGYTAFSSAIYSVDTVTRNAGATIFLSVPEIGSTPKHIEFKHVSGDDDWYIQNVETNTCATPPQPPVVLKADTKSTSGTGTSNLISIQDTTPTIEGTGVPGATIIIKDANNIAICTTVILANGTWVCTPLVLLSEGASTLSVTQTVGTLVSPPALVYIVIDTVAPTSPVITGPAQNAILTTATPTFIGTAEPLSIVKIYNEFNQLICTAITNTLGNWTCIALFGQGEGRKSFTAIATDSSGNISPSSNPPRVIFLDINTDSAPLIMENAAPNSGDNNGDGKLDSTQDNVTSKPNPNLGNNYSTLQVEGVGGNCAVVTNFDYVAEAVLPVQDSDRDYPLGLFKFTISCLPVGGRATVKILLDKQYDTSNWQYKKYNSLTKQYAIMPGVTYSTQIIGGATYTTINYIAVDGGDFDEDGVANGEFVDPNGPTISNIALANTGYNLMPLWLAVFSVILTTTGITLYRKTNNKKISNFI